MLTFSIFLMTKVGTALVPRGSLSLEIFVHTVSIISENSPGLESMLCAARAVHTSHGSVCALVRVCAHLGAHSWGNRRSRQIHPVFLSAPQGLKTPFTVTPRTHECADGFVSFTIQSVNPWKARPEKCPVYDSTGLCEGGVQLPWDRQGGKCHPTLGPTSPKGQSRGFGITPEMTSEHHVQGKEILKTNFPATSPCDYIRPSSKFPLLLGSDPEKPVPYTDLHVLPTKPPHP